MRIKKNIIISLTFLFWLALPLAVAAEDAAPVPAAVTPAPGTTKNAAEEINVQLKVPLPFVPTRCTTTVIDPNNPNKTITVPAVCNLKDYLEGIYRLLIGVGALFAVVMIIIAGYQYLTSGGSADKTGAAKKRIWNACIGLVLALLSYIILNAISARLVDLRLPLVAPIQRIEFDKEASCQANELFNDTNYVFRAENASGGAGTVSPVTPRAEALCGSNYEVYGSSDLNSALVGECPGDKCTEPAGSTCIMGRCTSAYLYGSLTAESAFSPTPHRRNVKNITVRGVCGSLAITADEQEIPDNALNYAFLVDKSGRSETQRSGLSSFLSLVACAIGDLKGFVLDIEVNTGLLGGINSHYFVGKDCTRSLADFRDGLPSFADVTPDELFQKEDLKRTPQRCDLDTQNFPIYQDL